MTNSDAGPARTGSRNTTASQVLGWLNVATAVVILIGVVDNTPDTLPAIAVILLVMKPIVFPMYGILMVFLATGVAFLWWMRVPKRNVILRISLVIEGLLLLTGSMLFALEHTAGMNRMILTVVYLGLGDLVLLFCREVVPMWEERGFLRQPLPSASGEAGASVEDAVPKGPGATSRPALRPASLGPHPG